MFVHGVAADSITTHEKVARQLQVLINAADAEGVQKLYSPELAKVLPLEKTAEVVKDLTQTFGKIESIGVARTEPPAVIFPLKFGRGALDLKLVLNAKEQIDGLFFQSARPVKPAPQTHETVLSLPFGGRWLVYWGGDAQELNYHHDMPNQRFAFDLLGVDDQGKTRRGKDKGNEDFYAFGREVLAPADGKVIEVIDGVRDNEPGSMNPHSAAGNCVVIQHRKNEVSVLAHFQQRSIRVKAGEDVKRGQVLGLCGNSGNSSEPHLHYHLQHSPILQDGLGIKVRFEKVVVIRDGKPEPKAKYSPTKGEVLSPE